MVVIGEMIMMKISDIEKRLKEIKEIHGDMNCFVMFKKTYPMEEKDMIVITHGNSMKHEDGVYFWKAEL